MHLPVLQALIRNEISPQAINVEQLIDLTEQYNDPQSAEYKLVELALNIILGSYLEKASNLI